MLPATQRPLILAHRGASRSAPENTLAAFEKALEMEADGIELDVRLSADGVPVVIHDVTVDATTDSTGRVGDMSLAQLKRLDAGSRFHPSFIGTRIPTLTEVLETFGGKLLLNVELKGRLTSDGELEQAVVDRLKQGGRGERDLVLLSSFNPLSLRRVQQLAPRVPTGLLYAYPPGLLLRQARSILPRPISALHPHHSVVSEKHARWIHARHMRINVWTVDEPVEMRRLIRLGVDGIITNAPDVLKQVLEAMP